MLDVIMSVGTQKVVCENAKGFDVCGILKCILTVRILDVLLSVGMLAEIMSVGKLDLIMSVRTHNFFVWGRVKFMLSVSKLDCNDVCGNAKLNVVCGNAEFCVI